MFRRFDLLAFKGNTQNCFGMSVFVAPTEGQQAALAAVHPCCGNIYCSYAFEVQNLKEPFCIICVDMQGLEVHGHHTWKYDIPPKWKHSSEPILALMAT